MITEALPAVRNGRIAPPCTGGLFAPVERKFDRPDDASIRRTDGSQRAQTLSHAARHEATDTGYQDGSTLAPQPEPAPSQIPACRSSTRAALATNSGSRTEIADMVGWPGTTGKAG